MKRTTVKLPDDLDALLRDEAQRLGTTVSEVVRRSIESFLVPEGRRFVASQTARGDGTPVAERADEILAEMTDDLYRHKMGLDP